MNFLCVYRPPRCDINLFNKYLDGIHGRTLKKNWIFVVDFNVCPLRNADSVGYQSLEDFFISRNFQ